MADGKKGLAIILSGMGKRSRGESDEDYESEDETMSGCDMALEDAWQAVKDDDKGAFKTAMRDAFAAYQDESSEE